MMTFEEKLSMKQDLDAEISRIKNERFNLSLPAAEMAAGDARGRLNSFLSQYQGEANIPDHRRGDFVKLRENSLEAASFLKKQKVKEAELTARLAKLEEQKATLSMNTGRTEILRIQLELSDIDTEAAALLAAIEGQDKDDENREGSFLNLEKHRAELLADAMLGKDVKTQLAEVEKELAKASKRINSEIDREEARAALHGRLVACQEKRARVAEVHQAALVGYLKSCVEDVSTDYRKKARELGECITRLIALYSIIAKADPADIFANQIGYELSRLILPGMVNDGGPIFRGEDIPLPVEIDKEKAKVEAQGVFFTV